VRASGRAVLVDVWFIDRGTGQDRVHTYVNTGEGMTLTNAVIYLWPRAPGEMSVRARVSSESGCLDQTAVPRFTTIRP
jgi:hypothetical protein